MKSIKYLKCIKLLCTIFNRRQRLAVFLLVLLIVVSAVIEVLSVAAAIPFVSKLTSSEAAFDIGLLKRFIPDGIASEIIYDNAPMIFAGAVLLSAICRYAVLIGQTRLAFRTGEILGSALFEKFVRSDYQALMMIPSSEIIALLTLKVWTIVNSVIVPILTIISGTVTAVFISIGLLAIDPKIAISTALVVGSAYLLITLVSKRYLKKEGDIVNRDQPHSVKKIQETFGSIKDVILDKCESMHAEEYRLIMTRLAKAQGNIFITVNAPRFAIESSAMLLIAFISFFYLKNNQTTTLVPILGAMALGAQKVLPVVQAIYANFAYIISAGKTTSEVVSFMEKPSAAIAVVKAGCAIGFESQIKMVGVSFSYNGHTKILENVDMEIPKGAIVGIVGESGSGKSTLIDMLMGFLHPNSGHIEIDHQKIKKDDVAAYQNLIAHVPQNVYIKSGTLIENLVLSKDMPIDKNWACQVLDIAELSDFVADNGEQEMFLRESGSNLSGGQRQRVGLARALYKRKPIIVLDEFTSALDKNTQRKILQNLKRLCEDGATMIVVTHNDDVMSLCDIIYKVSGRSVSRIK